LRIVTHNKKGYNDIKIPKFILQPLAENSIKYGKKTSVPLKITVSLENINSECVLISFTDNGKGCDHATVQSLNSQFSSGRYIYKSDTETSSTIGLKNINERIRLIYGEDYHITVNSEPDSFFEVIFRFPIIR
jgi:two-component system sensor histidine kinase YesM